MFAPHPERLRAWSTIVALVLVATCKRIPDEESPPETRSSDSQEPADPIPYEPEPFEVRTITRAEDLGPSFKDMRFRPDRTLVRGRSLRIAQHELPGSRIAIYETNRDGSPEIGRLYATDTGEALAEFRLLQRVSYENKVANVIGTDGHRHLLHLDTGRMISVTPRIPKGTVEETRLVFFPPPMSWVWLFARSIEGEVYHARWRVLDQPPPSLDEKFPMWPMSLEQNSLVLRPSGGHSSDCASVSFYPDETHQCHTGIGDYPFASGHIRFGKEKTIGKTRDAARPFPPCKSIGGGDSFAAERAIRYCPGPSEDETTLLVWGPDRVATTVARTRLPSLMSDTDYSILVPEPSTQPRSLWLDTNSFLRYETEPLWPFIYGEKGQKRTLVVSDRNYAELLILDFPNARLSRVLHKTGCYAYDWSFVRDWGSGVQCLNRQRELLETWFVDYDRATIVRVSSPDVWLDGNRNYLVATNPNRNRVLVMQLDERLNTP